MVYQPDEDQGGGCGPDEHYDPAYGGCVGGDTGGGQGPTTPPTGSGGAGACGAGTHQEFPVWAPGGTCVQDGSSTAGNSGSGMGDFQYPDFPGFNYDFNYGDAPVFTARRFTPTSLADAKNEPGYQFASDEGLRALQQSQAAKGLLRTGGSIKDLVGWNDKFAEQNYENVDNRRFRNFQQDYTADLDEYKPRLISYQTNAAGKRDLQLARSGDAWKAYLAKLNFDKDILLS